MTLLNNRQVTTYECKITILQPLLQPELQSSSLYFSHNFISAAFVSAKAVLQQPLLQPVLQPK
jgi:hypothetical protein